MSPVQTVTHVSGMDPKKNLGTARFELATPRTPSVCATGLRHVPILINQLKGVIGTALILFQNQRLSLNSDMKMNQHVNTVSAPHAPRGS